MEGVFPGTESVKEGDFPGIEFAKEGVFPCIPELFTQREKAAKQPEKKKEALRHYSGVARLMADIIAFRMLMPVE